jgi:tRNA(His) guanylyltransferase
MSEKTIPGTLGDRMKNYEKAWENSFNGEEFVVMRLDGHAFHTYTRELARPFDDKFVQDMNFVAEAVCKKMVGSQFAFTQSDEISILIKPQKTKANVSETYFSGRVSKILSLSSALASATFARLRPEQPIPLFDARIFSLPNVDEVESYFIWRQRDTIKNSIMSQARTLYSHTHLQNKRREELLAEIVAAGYDWNKLDNSLKFGRISASEKEDEIVSYFHKKTQQEEIAWVERNVWKTKSSPHFETESGREYLRDLIS